MVLKSRIKANVVAAVSTGIITNLLTALDRCVNVFKARFSLSSLNR